MVRTILTVVLGVAWCGGCTAVIVPPSRGVAREAGGAEVVVANYGYHSTLILPRADGGLVEYAYGDWKYFGMSERGLGSAVGALVASEQATLGRRVLERSPGQGGLEAALGAASVVRFEAPRGRVAEIERELDCRYAANAPSMVYSAEHGLYFVKDDERYGVANNCNHFTARGLERLGCRVEGVVVMASFKLKEEQGGATTRPTTRGVVAVR